MNPGPRLVISAVLLAGLFCQPWAVRADSPYFGRQAVYGNYPIGGWTREIPTPPYFAVYPPAYFRPEAAAPAPCGPVRPDEPRRPGLWIINPYATVPTPVPTPVPAPTRQPLPAPVKATTPPTPPTPAPATNSTPAAIPTPKLAPAPAPASVPPAIPAPAAKPAAGPAAGNVPPPPAP